MWWQKKSWFEYHAPKNTPKPRNRVYDTEKQNPVKKRKLSHERETDFTSKTPVKLVTVKNYVTVKITGKYEETFTNINII